MLRTAVRRWSVLPVLLMAVGVAGAEDAVNLVANPSFEVVGPDRLPASWRGDPAVYAQERAGAHGGSAALKYANADPRRYVLCTQKLPVQPGWKVRCGAWVKTKGLAGPESGATFCLEWTDRAGKWLGGCYPAGVGGTRDWTHIEAVIRVPEQAGAVTLACYVRRGMTGEAWFDDVEVVRLLDLPMTSVVLAPLYRGRLPAGAAAAVTARVRLHLADLAIPADQVQIAASIQAAGKDQALVRATTRPAPQTQVLDLTLPATPLTPGEYQLVLRLLDPAGHELQADRHPLTQLAPDAKFACTIDPHRRLLVDGQPFFPLGMYWASITEADLKQYAASKFNCLMPYGPPTREQLDLAQRHGLKVIYSVKDWYFGLKSCPASIRAAAEEEPAVRQRVREFREHPALLAWYLNDELGEEYLPRLEAHQRWVAEEDSQHPTWVVLFQVDQIGAYLKSFDVIGTDPYPIDRHPASMAAAWTAQTFAQVERRRPMWQVPQLHNWANYAQDPAERGKGRTPTPAEVRSMAWQCICEGATGLVFYSWFDLKRNPDVPFAKQWEALQPIAAEIDRLAPILLSVEAAPPIASAGQAPPWLHTLVRARGGNGYLFAANDGAGEGPITFALPPGARRIRELTAGRDVPVADARFAADLPKLAVKVYEITLDAAAPPATAPAATGAEAPRRVHVLVTGQVQGVGFRAFTQAQAAQLGLRGYVRNRDDGTVEAVAEGPPAAVARLLDRLRRGPQSARVEAVRTTDEGPGPEFAGFEVRP